MATALFDGAAKFASAIGVPLIGGVLLMAGWRWSFALTGASASSTFSTSGAFIATRKKIPA